MGRKHDKFIEHVNKLKELGFKVYSFWEKDLKEQDGKKVWVKKDITVNYGYIVNESGDFLYFQLDDWGFGNVRFSRQTKRQVARISGGGGGTGYCVGENDGYREYDRNFIDRLFLDKWLERTHDVTYYKNFDEYAQVCWNKEFLVEL